VHTAGIFEGSEFDTLIGGETFGSSVLAEFQFPDSEDLPDTLYLIAKAYDASGEEIPDIRQYVHKSSKANMTLDLIPSNQNLSITEINLRDEMGGEHTLAELLNPLRERYDYIVVDCNPYLGLLTINALAAADECIIPVSPQLWSATGLTDLLQTISKVKRKINPKIIIGGILLTMCDERTKLYKDAKALIDEAYGGKIKIFDTHIPSTVKVGEANYSSQSVMEHDPNGRAATAYKNFAREVIGNDGERKENGKTQATA
jgi:chromosome partitioning protein